VAVRIRPCPRLLGCRGVAARIRPCLRLLSVAKGRRLACRALPSSLSRCCLLVGLVGAWVPALRDLPAYPGGDRETTRACGGATPSRRDDPGSWVATGRGACGQTPGTHPRQGRPVRPVRGRAVFLDGEHLRKLLLGARLLVPHVGRLFSERLLRRWNGAIRRGLLQVVFRLPRASRSLVKEGDKGCRIFWI
jgi:hypothetical protein